MHDPLTVAFEIKYPWYRHKPWPKKYQHSGSSRWTFDHRMTDVEKQGRSPMWEQGYRDNCITIWHKDPETDGSDDSCGWAYPKLTKKQREILRNAAWSESRDPHFLRCRAKEWDGTVVEAELLYQGLIVLVVRVLGIKFSWEQICRMASETIHIRTCGKFGDTFCYLPGYHTNSQNDTEEQRQDHFHGILCGVARSILSEKRPWWKHPKWHIHHMRIQWHFGQKLYRFLFARCSKCGKRFGAWGQTAMSDWNGTQIWHEDCNHPNENQVPKAT